MERWIRQAEALGFRAAPVKIDTLKPMAMVREPCRFPEQAMSSVEGYGLFVTQVCRDNGLPYYDGSGTITHTACVLFDRHP